MPRLDQLVARTPLALLRSLARIELLLPYYHVVSDQKLPHLEHLFRYPDCKAFVSALDYLLRHFEPISVDDVVSRVAKGQAVGRNTFLITFDDGFRESFEVAAPLLREKGVPAVFFVNSAFIDNKDLFYRCKECLIVDELRRRPDAATAAKIGDVFTGHGLSFSSDAPERSIFSVEYCDKGVLDEIAPIVGVDFGCYLAEHRPYLTSEQVESLCRQGFHVGAHSVDHPHFGTLSLPAQLEQAVESMQFVKENFSPAYTMFSFPFEDIGVSAIFFESLYHGRGAPSAGDAATLECALSFGTSDMKQDSFPRHLHRFWMEGRAEQPELTIKRVLAKTFVRRLLGRNRIKRR